MTFILNTLKNLSGLNDLFNNENVEGLRDKINIQYSDLDLLKIPTVGSFITVSNRPIGFIEEVILNKLLSSVRSDISFLDSEFLVEYNRKFPKNCLPVERRPISECIKAGSGLCVFPAGSVSAYQSDGKAFTDSAWDKSLFKKIYEENTPIIPIYIDIENRQVFKMLSLIHPVFVTRKVIMGILKKNRIDVQVRIGKAVYKENYTHFSASDFLRFLRAKTYCLSSRLNVDWFFRNNLLQEDIIDAVNTDYIERELEAISDTNKIGAQGSFDVYLCKAKKIPNIMLEIGRLREQTFRAIGEGTLKAFDLDEYDLYYLHLFIYDRTQKKIAGAYRLGDGNYIMKSIGKKGFYLRSLFKMKNSMNTMLSESLELGRSFVVKEYQTHRLPLHLLWKGISYYIAGHNHLRYLIGPVSISSSYGEVSRNLMVSFVKKYHWDPIFASRVQAKVPFEAEETDKELQILIDSTANSTKLLDQLIEDIDGKHQRMPILLKKYFSQNAKIIGFNVDPLFNNALDGFMVCEIANLPAKQLETFGTNDKVRKIDADE